MRIRSTHASILLLTLAMGAGCDNAVEDPLEEPLVDGPGAFDPAFKTSEKFFTLMPAPKAGASPHGISRIWYSANIRPLEGKTKFTVPVGTIAIKEFDSDSDGTTDGLAVMIKREAGYDTAGHDWYYDMRDLAGITQDMPEPGPIAMCSNCHANAISMDFLPGFTLR